MGKRKRATGRPAPGSVKHSEQKPKRFYRPRAGHWQELVAELSKYRRRYGDCLVPAMWIENQSLAHWVLKMRSARKHGILTKEQIQELDQLGFVWDCNLRAKWEERFQHQFKALAAYQKKRGHCLVPNSYDRKLAAWVSCLRTQRKESKLAPKRIRLLNTLGFCWDPQGPVAADAYYKRGMERWKSGELLKAIEDFRHALQRNANHAAAFYHRGLAYKKLGKTYEASLDFARAKELGYKSS
jgi:tetratricopeptide (TPR) repeat protein